MVQSLPREIRSFNQRRCYDAEIAGYFGLRPANDPSTSKKGATKRHTRAETPHTLRNLWIEQPNSERIGTNMCQQVTKHAPSSRRVSADKQHALSMENTVRLRQMVDDYISDSPEVPERMHQATAEIRSRIDAAVDPLLSLGTDKPITNEEAFAAFNKLRGVLHGCALKGGAPQTEEEKLAKSLMVDYRKHAQDFAEAGLEVFSVPTRRTSTGAHFQLSQEITDQAKYALTDVREG